jgi:hypothetical protein
MLPIKQTTHWVSLSVWLVSLLAGMPVHAATKPASVAGILAPRVPHLTRMSYIENGDIRLGIDLNLGGAITYLAPVTNLDLNVINSHDWGREVQLSYYSGPIPFNPPGTTLSTNWNFLGWNPIQAGDCYGFTSQVLQYTNTGRALYVKLVPMQWPLKRVPAESECEVWIELVGPVVKARCRLTNHRADPVQYPARKQELPAVYVNAPFSRLVTYCGDKPFTSDALTRIRGRLDLQGHWANWKATENWAALVNDSGWGLGIWNPDAVDFTGGFFGPPGNGGPLDESTGYVAPNRDEIIDHNISFEYRYELMLGTVAQIRAQVYRVAKPCGTLRFDFENSRQGWYYADATDTGWPIRGELKVHQDGPHPRIFSPDFVIRAETGFALTLEAAFSNGPPHAEVCWRKLGDQRFDEVNAERFAIVPDGEIHRYEINLGKSPKYRGAITQLGLVYLPDTDRETTVRLKSVSLGPNGSPVK